MGRSDMPGRRGPPPREAVLEALRRGAAAGLASVAIYRPGDEVRCLVIGREAGFRDDFVCGGYLFTNGPEGDVHVQLYEPRYFNERRRAPRGNFVCPRQHSLEVSLGHAGSAA